MQSSPVPRPRRRGPVWRHTHPGRASASLAAALALLAASPACRKAPPAGAAAKVNHVVISNPELEKLYQSQFQNEPGASEDQVNSQKLQLLLSLVDSEIMRQRAEKLGLAASDSDVEARFTQMKAPFTKEEFERQLQARKMTAEDVRAQLRRELSIEKLINKEVTSHISITDADVSNFYKANQASYNLAEPQIRVAQILVTPFPDPNVRNLKNSKAQNPQQARQKIDDIAGRLQRGEDFAMLAQSFSEDPNTAPNGGDLGFIPESSLEKTSPDLRHAVISLQPGAVSPVIQTPDGYRILKLISREPAGQRELGDPRVQQDIRDRLINRREQLLKNAYLEMARNEAKVDNYFAQRIVESARAKK